MQRRQTPTPTPIQPRVTTVRWLHIPKAGSSFINVLWRYACPSAPAELAAYWRSGRCANVTILFDDAHAPAVYPRDAGKLVGLFRAPAARRASCWTMLQAQLRPTCMLAPTWLDLRRRLAPTTLAI